MPKTRIPRKPGLPVRCTMVSIVALRGSGGNPRMLVVRRAGAHLHGTWSYIAGHAAEGEAGWQTALREETGLAPDALYATSFCEQFYSAQADCIEIVPAFVACIVEGAEVHLNAEHSESRWARLGEAAGLLPFGSQRELLAHVCREFIERRPSAFLRMPPE